MSEVDRSYLDAAIELAERGLFSATPNPRVGCLLVKGANVIGKGWHVRTGQNHAERNALENADGDVSGATAYVSLEPCAHSGRTPPCADALIEAKVARVVAAMSDPDPRVSGKGFERLEKAGIAVEVEEMAAAQALNAGYVRRVQHRRPIVRIKMAMSLDGRTAMAGGESQWITGEQARADVQYWRARSCAIVTGIGTVVADDPALSVRDERFRVDGILRQPLRVVVDSHGRVPANAKLFDDGADVLLATAGSGIDRHERAKVHRQPGPSVDVAGLLRHLGTAGCNEILVEAGAGLAGSFIRDGLWDEMVLYFAPKLLGSEARPLAELALTRMSEAIEGKISSTAMLGEDLRVIVAKS
ncbi:MAG: bifunctional diaminohydroxyphosphoribosylaminopyrimidine deaminase/5-amino-6-(5-phosphoribosylamino)uracil reductase RibD [Gammaproteobacteria bacterium]|nr:bifunctional diaminohydroxyphosphoribosylaminopyrimidine deaminase/5-amino-6-(5-phosphoribosylamino)uracil reductase RibD [Gammaproteobacteria bacterium]